MVIAKRLWFPHYSDERFKGADGRFAARTIFLAEGVIAVPDLSSGFDKVNGAEYQTNHDLEVSRRPGVKMHADRMCIPNTPQYIEGLLRGQYMDPDLALVHVVSGVEDGTWNTYNYYGFMPSRPLHEA